MVGTINAALPALPPAGTITIDASGSDGIDFEDFIRGGFLATTTGGGFPVFDNSAALAGEEMLIGFGTEAASPYVLAQGEISYFFPTHTVNGTINTIEYGTRGEGTFDSEGHFVGGDAQLRITGLEFFNASSPEAEVEANGPVHNFTVAHMAGTGADPNRLAQYADDLDAYTQHFIGSVGGDEFAGAWFDDEIEGGGGADTLSGGGGGDTIDGGDGDDDLQGARGADVLDGSGGADTLNGSAGGDSLDGGSDNDRLVGGQGDDTLTGGTGKDVLNGGGGGDDFVYASESESDAAARDTLVGFVSGEDTIDLSAIATLADGEDFTFVESAGFSGEAGELRFVQGTANTLVYGDVDGDGAADFALHLKGVIALVEADFIL